MFHRCYECKYWDGNPQEPERIELCNLHKMVMRGCRNECPQFEMLDIFKKPCSKN